MLSLNTKKGIISVVTVFVTVIIPTLFLKVPMPATQKDIQVVEDKHAKLSKRVDELNGDTARIYMIEKDGLTRLRDFYVAQKITTTKAMDKIVKSGADLPDVYPTELSRIDKNIKEIDDTIVFINTNIENITIKKFEEKDK